MIPQKSYEIGLILWKFWILKELIKLNYNIETFYTIIYKE